MTRQENHHSDCLICGNEKISALKGYEVHFLTKCASCGFVFASKKPSPKELEEHYNKYLRNDYLSPVTIKRYQELLDDFEGYKKTGNILDIGCGIGHFLEQAKKRGWRVYGTEFTDDAVDICEQKGIQMKKGILDSIDYSENFFDVITSFEVIEHINNPVEEVNRINYILRKEGVFYCTTPNFNALQRYKLKKGYNIISYPEHLSYYTTKTLKKIMRDNLFKPIKVITSGYSITRQKISTGKSDQEIVSATSDDEKLRILIEKKPLIKLAKKLVNSLLNFFGVGITIKGYFVKR